MAHAMINACRNKARIPLFPFKFFLLFTCNNISWRRVWKILFIFFEVEPVRSLPAGAACILLYILRGWIGVSGPPARTVIAQACRSGRGLSRGGQAENLCAIPVPPLKSTRQSLHHHLLLHRAVIWPSPKGWAEAAAPHPLPCGLEGGNLQLGHRGNGYTDS